MPTLLALLPCGASLRGVAAGRHCGLRDVTVCSARSLPNSQPLPSCALPALRIATPLRTPRPPRRYLLKYSVDDLLYNFRKRAGIPQPPGAKCVGWDCRTDWIEGSLAGLFLMGAGGHLRWVEHPVLRAMMNELIDGIENCTMPDGYLAAFPQAKLATDEHPGECGGGGGVEAGGNGGACPAHALTRRGGHAPAARLMWSRLG